MRQRKQASNGGLSIFFKLIMTYLCITVPIYGMYISLYRYSYRNMKNQASAFFSTQSSYFLRQWESDINNINNMMLFYTLDDNIEIVSQIPEGISFYDRIFRINQIVKSLSSIRYSSKYAIDSALYLPLIHKTISVTDGVSDLDMNFFDMLRQKIRYSPDYFLNIGEQDADRMAIVLTSPLIHEQSTLPTNYIMLTELSIPQIQEDLDSFAFTEQSTTILVNPTAQFYISSSPASPIMEVLKEAAVPQDIPGSIEIDGVSYQIFLNESQNSSFLLASFVPESELYPFIPFLQFWGIAFFSISMLMVLGFSLSIHRIIKRPVDTLIHQFHGDHQGNLEIYTGYTKNDEFQSLYQSYNAMVERIHILINQVYVQQLLAQKAELKQLQTQINPHFLYNSFFTLSLLARKGDFEQVTEFAQRLGEYFKYITRNAADEVPLKMELDHAQQYAAIQQIRFSNRLLITIDPLTPEQERIIVPRLILQPLFENAFVHGIEQRTSGAQLHLSCEIQGSGIWIRVEDNGQPPTQEMIRDLREKLSDTAQTMETTALVNIHRRLKLYYHNQSGIDVAVSRLGGWCIVLKIYPL